ncbi:MAG: tetratricopeptide repeat protein [Gammaproteobacteria bacterium]|nr:MAG: tetratricopeptide repeat protein [Gammaproteobacteria bacterium]
MQKNRIGNLWKVLWFLSVFGLLFNSTQIYATALSDFEQGNRLFNEGDYRQAVSLFESAYKKGMRSVSLYYNLGSAYFKLDDLEKSKYYFKKVAQSRNMRALAHYNLGLIALRQNQTDEARQYFSSVIALKQDQKLTTLASRQLDIINQEQSQKSSFIYLSAGIGYDDNITAVSDSVVSNVSDMFYDVFATGEFTLSGNKQQGWLTDVNFSQINYMDSGLYDESLYGVAVKKTDRINGWLTQLMLQLDKSSYGGEDFQTLVRLDASLKYPLSRTDRFYFKYRYDDIASDNLIYDYLQGWRQILRPEFRQYAGRSITAFYYELELNDRQDTSTASYSPTRHTFRGRYTYRLNDTWHLSGDLSWRRSDYPFVAIEAREDERLRIGAHVDYLLDKTLKIRARLIYTDNESNQEIYDYSKTTLGLSLSKSF